MGKSVHEKLNQTITYGQCCQQYFTGMYDIEQLHLICPKCCHDLQRVYALHTDAEQLTDKIRHAWHKTKRLNRARRVRPSHPSPANRDSGSLLLPTPVVRETMRMPIKEELPSEESSATDLTVGYVPPYELPSTEQEHAMKNSPQTCGNEPIAGSEMKLPVRSARALPRTMYFSFSDERMRTSQGKPIKWVPPRLFLHDQHVGKLPTVTDTTSTHRIHRPIPRHR